MANEACKLLREIDGYFKNGIVDVAKFDNSNLFEYKCPYDRINKKYRNCENNNERINALGGYFHGKLSKMADKLNGKGDNGNRHIEIFIMWLSDKLYKLEENKIKNVEEFYQKHLEKYMPNFNYWNLLNSKKEYKRANVWYMSELYRLLNCICNIVIEYKKNKNNKKIEQISSQCYKEFKNVYNNVNNCYSYFHLLKYLKSIYDDIRNDAIKKAAAKKSTIKQNVIRSGIKRTISLPPNTKLSEVLEYVMKASTISLIDLTPSDWNQRFLDVSDQIVDFHTQKCVNSYSELVEEVKKQERESKNRQKAHPQAESDKSGKEVNQISPEGQKDANPENFEQTQQPPSEGQKPHDQSESVKPPIPSLPQAQPEPPSASQKSETSPQSGTKDSGTQKGNSDTEGGEKEDPDRGKGGTNNLSGSTGGGPGSGTGDTSDGASGGQVGTDSGSDSQGGSSNQRDSVDGPKASGDQVPTHPSGASNGYLPRNWGISLNLTSYIPSGSGIYQSSKNILTSATNKISDVYSSTVGIVKGAYDKTVATVKNAYTASTNYISGAVSGITNQFNPFGTFQLSDDQSGSNSLGGGMDTSDQSQLKSPPPPPSPSSPVTPLDSPTPLDPQPLSDSSSPKSIDSQTRFTQIHKCQAQQITPTDGNIGSQTPLFGQGTLTISGSNPSNTKNENLITVAKVKVKEAPSIWCIGPNNKCGITGISIIVISISIVLTIMYKYLSLGCTSKSKRKKSMKKVINSIGGKRPVQIIIKSFNTKKMISPIISPVRGEKKSSLNIYKLMQADPVPFINLFFLLIFFVYKRQLNYLEL
ncbi:PIR protein CIR protein [Plasmodium vinckei lentum]|uniref:PIR protein CIR protein n=1 Tax=Plasmodium vinckei lentum TaxID=138297 RepID=A0A6V7SMA6_PLAVN|nr:PIR protein CIR protein [Plasmodium vinckei lentum]